jgi:hypothetical protein
MQVGIRGQSANHHQWRRLCLKRPLLQKQHHQVELLMSIRRLQSIAQKALQRDWIHWANQAEFRTMNLYPWTKLYKDHTVILLHHSYVMKLHSAEARENACLIEIFKILATL